VLYDFAAQNADPDDQELSVSAGERVLAASAGGSDESDGAESGWRYVQVKGGTGGDGRSGFVPLQYLQEVDPEGAPAEAGAAAGGGAAGAAGAGGGAGGAGGDAAAAGGEIPTVRHLRLHPSVGSPRAEAAAAASAAEWVVALCNVRFDHLYGQKMQVRRLLLLLLVVLLLLLLVVLLLVVLLLVVLLLLLCLLTSSPFPPSAGVYAPKPADG